MLRSFKAVASLCEAPILLHALTSYASGNPMTKEVACMLTELDADKQARIQDERSCIVDMRSFLGTPLAYNLP